MSYGHNYLHSHSGIERELKFPKDKVLIDKKYGDMFEDAFLKPFSYKGKDYLKVNIYIFWKKGGVFKNLFS